LPNFATEGFFEVLLSLLQVITITRTVGIKEIAQAHRDYAIGNGSFTQDYLFNERIIVKGIAESFPDIDVGEEMRRNPVPIQLTAADKFIVHRVDLLVKDGTNIIQPRKVTDERYPFHPFQLWRVFNRDINRVRFTFLQHQFPGVKLSYTVIDDHCLDRSRSPPIIGMGFHRMPAVAA